MATLNALTRLTSRSHWYTYVWYIHTMRALVQLGARQSSSDPSSSREHLLLRPTRCSLRAVPSSLGSSWVLQYVSTLLQPQQRQEQAHTGLFKGVTRDWGVCEDGVKTQAKRTRASACLEKTRVRCTQGCLGAATTALRSHRQFLSFLSLFYTFPLYLLVPFSAFLASLLLRSSSSFSVPRCPRPAFSSDTRFHLCCL